MVAAPLASDWLLVVRALLGEAAAARIGDGDEERLATVLEARAVLERKARSFALASRLLPHDVRDDLAILYRFCRLADDACDDPGEPAVARRTIEALHDELAHRAPPRPLVAAFRALAARIELPLSYAGLLLDGVASDLGPVRVEDDGELIRYCYRVAGTVGLMLCPLLGVRHRRALPHAIDLGIAMQLSNIVRDVVEDAARDRVYLPRTRLAAAGISPEAIVSGTASPSAVRQTALGIIGLADHYYRSAEQGMAAIPIRNRFGILAASRLYRAIGHRSCRWGRGPSDGRAIVSRGEKMWQLAAAIGAGLTPALLGVGRCPPHQGELHLALAGLPGVHA